MVWGVACPPGVYTAGAKPVALSDGIMPTPWDPVLLTKELAFLQAFAARYGNDPSLAGVMIGGLGQVMETYVARTPADSAILNPLGGVPAWIAAGQTLITAFAEALPNKSVILTAAVLSTERTHQHLLAHASVRLSVCFEQRRCQPPRWHSGSSPHCGRVPAAGPRHDRDLWR